LSGEHQHPSERLARRREARARRLRRRRLLALAAVAVIAIAVIAQLAGGGGSASRPRSASGLAQPRASSPARPVHVVLERAGTLPQALQDTAATALADGRVMVAGGLAAGETSLADVVLLSGSSARRVGSLAAPLHDACAAVVGGQVYVFGGGQVSSYSSITRVSVEGAAEAAGELPTPASDLACASSGTVAYLVGGYTGSEPLRTILAWRPGAAARVVAYLPEPLRYAAVALTPAGLVIAGGTSGTRASRDVYRLDPTSGRLRRIALLPRGITHAAGAALGADALVIGGREAGEDSQLREVLAISPGGAVSVVGELPLALSDVAVARSGGEIVLAGGRDRAGAQQRSVFRMSPARAASAGG
jgi:hypothetical protein